MLRRTTVKLSRVIFICYFTLISNRIATGWTVRGSNSGGGDIFRTRQDRPWGPHSFLYDG